MKAKEASIQAKEAGIQAKETRELAGREDTSTCFAKVTDFSHILSSKFGMCEFCYAKRVDCGAIAAIECTAPTKDETLNAPWVLGFG